MPGRTKRDPVMNEPPSAIRRARFGAFEVDLATGELSENGSQVTLPEQPLQILAMLLERSGDLVTREELQQKLWPNTFVDAEHSLNAAVKRLRAMLSDDSENPRFIETIPRRGYRFLHPVEFMSNGRRADKVSIPPDNDPFLAELREIRGQLLNTNSLQVLNSLRHRTGGLQNRYPQHPKLYEAQILQDDIMRAIDYSTGTRTATVLRAVTYGVKPQTAARIFDDRDALTMPGPVDGQWQTLGTIGKSIPLIVKHTVHEENGREVIRIRAARKATRREREAYEQRRQRTDR
jgi:DNA-binding winged helix-turn-helix (wHTH) protein/uncharacterized DUF497 family protein